METDVDVEHWLWHSLVVFMIRCYLNFDQGCDKRCFYHQQRWLLDTWASHQSAAQWRLTDDVTICLQYSHIFRTNEPTIMPNNITRKNWTSRRINEDESVILFSGHFHSQHVHCWSVCSRASLDTSKFHDNFFHYLFPFYTAAFGSYCNNVKVVWLTYIFVRWVELSILWDGLY